jgi:hypothetical protein
VVAWVALGGKRRPIKALNKALRPKGETQGFGTAGPTGGCSRGEMIDLKEVIRSLILGICNLMK